MFLIPTWTFVIWCMVAAGGLAATPKQRDNPAYRIRHRMNAAPIRESRILARKPVRRRACSATGGFG